MLGLWKQCFKDESGATAIEYALIAAFLSLAVVAGAQAVGLDLQNIFGNAASSL
ncbi:MAG: Flp family type IVb pilin [Hyphomicrobiaceae bacterium]